MSWTVRAGIVGLAALLSIGCSDPAPSPTTALPPATAPTITAPATSTSASGEETTVTSTSTTAPVPMEGTLHVGTAAPLESLDPADAVTLAEWEVILAMSEGLMVQEAPTGDLAQGLAAEPPVVSDDGLTYTVRLDAGTRFSDGLALTAPLYAQSLERVMTIGGRASDLVTGFVEGVEAPDDTTLVFHLRRPVAFFPVLLAGPAYVPVHPDDFPADSLAPRPEPPIHGVGEWFIADMTDDQVVLEPNPETESEATLESVVIHYYPTTEEMTDAMADGDLDVAWRGVGPDSESHLTSVEGINVAQAPGGVLEFLVLNHERPPTDDPLVRQALASLVDREVVAEEVLEGAVEPAYSPVPAGFLGSIDSFRDAYGEPDAAAAISALEEAGYTSDEPALLELGYPPERFGVHIARAMEELERQMEATGLIDVTLTAQAWNTYVGEVVAGTYNAALLGWVFDFPDPHNYLAPFLLQGGLGGSGAGDAEAVDEMVALLEDAAVEIDTSEREDLYTRLQQLYADEVVTLPLWVDPEAVAYWDHVSVDPAGPLSEALNIGPTLRLDYGSVRVRR